MNYTILRYGNVYGPGQAAKGEGGVVALFMERLKKEVPCSFTAMGHKPETLCTSRM